MSTPVHPSPSLVRRLASSAVDGCILFLVPIIWWHWAEWARYTGTFGRRLPATVAMPLMTIIPLTVIWLEAVFGRSLGKVIFGLRVVDRRGGQLSTGRRFLRSVFKWSPIWIGPAVWMVDAFTRGSRADDFSNDYLLSPMNDLAEVLPDAARRTISAINVSLRGMNWGVLPAVIIVVGSIAGIAWKRKSLCDLLAGTKTVRK